MTSDSKSTLLRNGMLVFAAQMAVNVCNFGFHALVSRRVGVAEYGTLNALVSGFQILVVPAVIVTTVLVKYAADFHARGETGRLQSLLSQSTTILGIFAAALFLGGLVFSSSVAAFFHTADRLAVVLMLAILCFNMILPIRGILQGLENFKPYSVSLSIEALVKVAVAAVLTFLGWGIDGALGGWLIGCAVALAFTWSVQALPRRNSPPVSIDVDIRSLVSTSGVITVAMLCVTSLGFSDVVLVKHYFDANSAGLYGAAALAGKMLYFLVYFVPAVVLPRVAVTNAQGRPTAPILLAALGVVFVLAGGGLALYYFAPAVVVKALAGRAFFAAAPLVFPYGCAAALLGALNTVVTYKIGLGRHEFVVPLAIVAMAQIAAVAFFHSSPQQIIAVLVCCDTVALIAILLPLPQLRMGTVPVVQAQQRSTP